MAKLKKLFAGPWVGEFGWELFGWQGHIRKIAEDFDEVIVASRPDREFLYQDFCTQFAPYDPKTDVCDYHLCEGNHEIHRDYEHTALIKPKQMQGEAKYVKYGKKTTNKHDIIVHARNREHGNKKNWPIKRWNRLINGLLKEKLNIVCVGTAALHFEGTQDCRNIPLNELADLLTNAKLAVGSSSGPMHFAALCCCPHFVWCKPQGRPNVAERYRKLWNPFQTKVEVYTEGRWRPKPNVILNKILDFYEEL
jgi:hypothetical protein